MMMNRRSFLALAAAVTLSACAAPLLEEGVAQQLKITSVSVDVSSIEGVKGRKISKLPEQVRADIAAAVSGQLAAGSVGTRPAKAQLSVKRVQLVSPGQSFLIGGSSTISGTLQVTDARTGEVILAPTDVVGTAKSGYALGGVIGAAVKANQTPEDDYKATVAGFAADVRKRLLGAQK